jgi:hypothetical protein
MSYKNAKVDELKELAAFYTVEPKVADPEHGATRKELLAALAEENVTAEDYQTFKEAKAAGTDKTLEEKREEAAAAMAAAAEAKAEEEEAAPAESDDEVEADAEEAVEVAEEQGDEADDEDEVLVKMERKNGTYEAFGLRFTKDHPFKSVPASIAEKLITQETGFRLALPSEVKDYYN